VLGIIIPIIEEELSTLSQNIKLLKSNLKEATIEHYEIYIIIQSKNDIKISNMEKVKLQIISYYSVSHARNLGLEMLSQKCNYVYFLDQDALPSVEFLKLIIVGNILLLFFSFFILNMDFIQGSGADTSRLLDLNDESNYIRFTLNKDALLTIFNSLENLLTGLGETYPMYTPIQYKVHNGFLDIAMTSGLVYAIFFILIISLKFYPRNYENAEYLISICVFSFFLPNVFTISFMIIIFLILSIINKSEDREKCLQ